MREERKKRVFLNDWWKQFLTGVMGTAIGVGLTFAVSNLVDNNKKEQVQRQTATMAVYDIDEIIREMKEDLQQEDAAYPLAMYLASHPEKVDVVSVDTLGQTIAYLMEDVTSMPDWAMDTKEKAFTSSMDAWQNLENTQFYDNVQRCYLKRAELLRVMKNDEVFRRPFTDANVDQFIGTLKIDELEFDGSLTEKALRKLVKKAYEKPETIRYLRRYLLRSRVYNEYIDELTRLNQENKFLMELSDEEMEAYIRKNVRKTQPASTKLLVGRWQAQMNDAEQTFTFRADHSMDVTTEMTAMADFTVESEDLDVRLRVPVSYRMGGEWVLAGDTLSLILCPRNSEILSIGLDLDNLPESAQEKGKKWMESYRQEFELYVQSADTTVQQNYIHFDLTGNRMFWTIPYTTVTGQPETVRQQLVRMQE